MNDEIDGRLQKKGLLKLWVGSTETGADINLFWEWAFWKVNTPMLRGVLIEFLLVKHLLDHANDVVGDRIRSLTHDVPDQGRLRKSLERFYMHQPHGDFFDLQLQWGVTVEIKSTIEANERALENRIWWGVRSGQNRARRVFPAQFYIVAVLPDLIKARDEGVFVPELKCYVMAGAELDKLARGRKSVPFKDWRSITGAPCTFDEVFRRLHEVQHANYLEVRSKLMDGWRMPRPSRQGAPLPLSEGRTFVPVAMDDGESMDLAWWDMTDLDPAGHFALDVIPYPFKPARKAPSWRDWEAAGFRYDAKSASEPAA